MFADGLAAQFHRRPKIHLLINHQDQREHPRHREINAWQYQTNKSDQREQEGHEPRQEQIQKSHSKAGKGRVHPRLFVTRFFQQIQPQATHQRTSGNNANRGRRGGLHQQQYQRANPHDWPKITEHQRPAATQAISDVQRIIVRQNFLAQRFGIWRRSGWPWIGNRFHCRFHLACLLVTQLRLLLQRAKHHLVQPHIDLYFS